MAELTATAATQTEVAAALLPVITITSTITAAFQTEIAAASASPMLTITAGTTSATMIVPITAPAIIPPTAQPLMMFPMPALTALAPAPTPMPALTTPTPTTPTPTPATVITAASTSTETASATPAHKNTLDALGTCSSSASPTTDLLSGSRRGYTLCP
uniref:Uncharacterized protein n=1 Tax=Octopus bimaculoides TaxID=37653 RepID=A0A0L8GE34_OCTBM